MSASARHRRARGDRRRRDDGGPGPSARRPVSEGLARAYDAILDARFDHASYPRSAPVVRLDPGRSATEPVAAQRQHRAGRGLRRAARDGALVADPARSAQPRARRPRFTALVERAMEARKPGPNGRSDDAEAWFYLGGAYAARAQWRVLRDERLAAARDGKRIKDALDRAVALDPQLNDAYFGLGLYKYLRRRRADRRRSSYAGSCFCPAGTTSKASAEMLRAQTAASCCREKRTTSSISSISGTSSGRPGARPARGTAGALPFESALSTSDRPRFTTSTSTTCPPASPPTELLAAAGARRVISADGGCAGPSGIARRLETLAESDGAIEHLRSIVDARPESPFGVVSEAQLRARPVLRADGDPFAGGRGVQVRARRDPGERSGRRARPRGHRARAPNALTRRRGVPPVARGLASVRAR